MASLLNRFNAAKGASSASVDDSTLSDSSLKSDDGSFSAAKAQNHNDGAGSEPVNGSVNVLLDDADPVAGDSRSDDDISFLKNVGVEGDDSVSDGVYVPSFNKRWIIVIVAALVVLLCAGVWFAQNTMRNEIIESHGVGNNSIGTGTASGSTPTVLSDTIFKDLNIPEFYQKPALSLSEDEVAQAQDYSLNTLPTNATGLLPSKASNPNLTDDPSKYLNDDGTLNANYSYLTEENTLAVMQDDLQRMINPVYGDWVSLQNVGWVTTDGLDVDTTAWVNITDMLTPDVADTVTDAASARKVLGVYADWDQNEYGGEFAGKEYNAAIVGVPIGEHCDYQIAATTDDHIDCSYRIRYTANVGESKKTVDKTLNMHWKINYDETGNNGRRVLLVSSDLQ